MVSTSKKCHEKLKSSQEDNKEKAENNKLETVAVGDEKKVYVKKIGRNCKG